MAARNGRAEIIEYLLKEHDPTLIDAMELVCILSNMYLLYKQMHLHVGWYEANSLCQYTRERKHI